MVLQSSDYLLLILFFLVFIVSGLEFLDEHLMVFKLVLERMAKYLLLPVVALDININAKLVALNGEIMIYRPPPQKAW